MTDERAIDADARQRPSGTPARPSKRIPILDGWRATSILLVLGAHLLPLGPKVLQLNDTAGAMGMALVLHPLRISDRPVPGGGRSAGAFRHEAAREDRAAFVGGNGDPSAVAQLRSHDDCSKLPVRREPPAGHASGGWRASLVALRGDAILPDRVRDLHCSSAAAAFTSSRSWRLSVTGARIAAGRIYQHRYLPPRRRDSRRRDDRARLFRLAWGARTEELLKKLLPVWPFAIALLVCSHPDAGALRNTFGPMPRRFSSAPRSPGRRLSFSACWSRGR